MKKKAENFDEIMTQRAHGVNPMLDLRCIYDGDDKQLNLTLS